MEVLIFVSHLQETRFKKRGACVLINFQGKAF